MRNVAGVVKRLVSTRQQGFQNIARQTPFSTLQRPRPRGAVGCLVEV